MQNDFFVCVCTTQVKHSADSRIVSLIQVDTVKRMCVKKLPKVLVIQLKRFDYDWERCVCVIVCTYSVHV